MKFRVKGKEPEAEPIITADLVAGPSGTVTLLLNEIPVAYLCNILGHLRTLELSEGEQSRLPGVSFYDDHLDVGFGKIGGAQICREAKNL